MQAPAHPFDSELYGHLWATSEVRELFSDAGRTQAWLEVLVALADCQAELGIVPASAAVAIRESARVEQLDLDLVARRTRESGHSTQGLIDAVKAVLPDHAVEWVYYGATVQDVTDTWTGMTMRRMLEIVDRDLETIERALLELAVAHRNTVMLGRTHGQPGLPITAGFKAAVWAAEVRRHRDRVAEVVPRAAVGQLAGAVGTCSFWGEGGLELQRLVCRRLGLGVPDTTWLTARDRVSEFTVLLALVTGTLAKIGREVCNLQRPELGELREAPTPGVVGSITMPHKRNPERSEHLGTLWRLVRSAAGLALEGMVHQHERDGEAWKAEWAFLPEACLATSVSLSLAADLVDGVEVDVQRMAANVAAQDGYVLSEPVMLALAASLGKHRAHAAVYRAAMAGVEAGCSFREALAGDPEIAERLSGPQLDALLDPRGALGCAGELVDRVLAAGRPAR